MAKHYPTQITSDKRVKIHKKRTYTFYLNARVHLSRLLGTQKKGAAEFLISAAHTDSSYIYNNIQFARMHKAKLWQNHGKTLA